MRAHLLLRNILVPDINARLKEITALPTVDISTLLNQKILSIATKPASIHKLATTNFASEQQFIWSTCKLKRRSNNAPTTLSTGRRSDQISKRVSASQIIALVPTSTQTFKRTAGNSASPTLVRAKAKGSENTCSVPSYVDFQQQIDAINDSTTPL